MPTRGQVGEAVRPGTTDEVDDVPALATELADLIDRLDLSPESPPPGRKWRELLRQLDEGYCELSRLRTEVFDLKRGWSSFENLFRTSPVPMMEQDYSEIEDWLDELRAEGVGHVRDVLGTDIEAIRRIVPKIRVVAANPAAVEAVGLPLERLIGPIDPIIVNEGSEPSWLSQIHAIWERRPFAHASFVASTAEGQRFDAESILSAPIINGEPDYSRAVFSLIDITPHRDEERRMAGVVEAKNRFLASVSHEIRTPLTAILGFARVIQESRDLTEDDRKLMNSSIAEHAQEMSNLVEDLLVAARADMNQLDIIDVEVDVLSEIEATVRAGGSYTTDVTMKTATEEPYARADPVRVRQILRNLLTNAERYGGDEVSVTVSRKRGKIIIEVADNGEGLPGDDWERIFEPYESAHILKGSPGAVGIGLTISRQLAELMGGSLRYEVAHNRSVFRLTLPAARR